MAKKGDMAFLTPLSTIFQLYRGGQFQKKRFNSDISSKYS